VKGVTEGEGDDAMSVGLSEARLGRLRDVMAGYVERGAIPGIVTAVSRRGETHVEAFGTLEAGGSAPMRRDTIFRVASLTKPVTAVAAMILVEECRLRLDDPVDRYLPELADRKVLKRLDGPLDDTVPADRPISLRDLLTLRMGFGYPLGASDEWPIRKAMVERGVDVRPEPVKADPDAWITSLGSLPLLHQPGEVWMYDTASDVLGLLIARASGQPLEMFFRERIFEPLGMNDTAFSVPADKVDRLATCYQSDHERGGLKVWDPAEGGYWSRPPAFQGGRGGLVSTVDDYLAFGQMMLNAGRHGPERILSRLSVEAMTTNQLSPEQRAGGRLFLGPNRGWGLGLAVCVERDEISAVPGRFGWDGGYGTSWTSDRAEGLIGILLTQRLWDSPEGPNVVSDFWTSAYAAIDD
jgi:CubicO group peptidase (beta-lactamase class C family)